MEANELAIFRALLSDVYARATGGGILPVPLPESEAKTLTQILEESVHRTISEKTLRNYVRQVLGSEEHISPPNPSPFHLETLARYALGLEGNNKNGDKAGTPAWFKYRQIWRERQEQRAVGKEVETQGLPRLSKKRLWRGGTLLLFLAVTLAVWQWPDQPKYWEEPFDDVSVESLKSRGWEILDYDSVAFSKQIKPGHLTLHTYPGDYWVKWEKGEKPFIKNMLLKALGGKDCIVSTSINHYFDPKQNHQQAGLFLFGEEKDPNNSIRVCYIFEKTKIKTMVFGNQPTDRRQSIHIVQMHDGHPFAYRAEPLRFPEFQPQPFLEVGIIIRIRGKIINLSCWEGFPWSPAHPVNVGEDIELPFFPKYVGLGAFQGFTDDNGKPKGADPIPAFFDYLKVDPLPE